MTPKNPNVPSFTDQTPFQCASPTYMEKWYDLLKDETIESHFIPLEQDEIHFCLQLGGELGLLYKQEVLLNAFEIKERLLKKIGDVLKLLNNKAFFRLTSRSPKDSWYGLGKRDLPYFGHKGLTLKPEDVFFWIADSERVHDDLYESLHYQHQPQIVLRKWIDLKRHEEFRCFIIKKEVMGISQYFYRDYFPDLISNATQYQETILSYFERIKDKIPLENYILDIVLIENVPKVLEINPLSQWTDPCLFDWEEDSFEEPEFRYMTEQPPKRRSMLDEFLEEHTEE